MSSIQLVGSTRSAWSLPRLGAIALLALLAGCKSDVTVDMSTDLPADPNVTQVVANIRGLEFTGGSGTKTLEFRDPQSLDFMDYSANDNAFRVFTNEELPEGRYTGVRLLLDEDQDDDEAFVTVSGTTRPFPLNIVQGDYASIDFEFEDNKNESESFTMMLDLRASLSFNDDTDEYTFTPVLRAVHNKDISSIRGDVTATCPAGDSLVEGAVYLFQGENITPDDLDGAGVEPFATSPVFSTNNTSFFYSLRVLPAGKYTMALTCIGNDDDPATNQDLEFRNVVNVELDENEALDRDLP